MKYKLSLFTGFILLFAVYHFPEFYNVFWIAAVFKIGFLLVSHLVAKYQGLGNLGAFGLNLHKGWAKHLYAGIGIGLCFFIMSFVISRYAGFLEIDTGESIVAFFKQLPLILLMTVFPSIAEDILTRGYLFAHTRNMIGGNSFILLSSVIYVLNHVWRLNDGPAVLAYLFILGLALAYAVWKTKSLWLAFGIHWGSNIAYESIRSLFHTTDTGNGFETTWVLAASFAVMLGFLIATTKWYRPSTGIK